MTSSTFVHVGDVHLQATSPRNPDRLQAFDQILTEGLQLPHLAAWLIPGDLFHARSTIDDRNALAERLVRMAAVAPVVLVRGNHDAYGDLEIFARLKAAWPVVVVTRPMVLSVPCATGETAAIACLPYPDKVGLVAAGVEPSAVSPTAAALLDVIFMQLAHELEVPRVSGAIPLFLGHANIRGAIASTGQPQIGLEQEIDRLSLERLPVLYCGLNHIHKPQEVGTGVYAGSIAAMDHGETEAKSYVVLETERQADGSWAATWTRRPIHTPPMFHIDGELTREGFQPDHDEWMCPACSGTGDNASASEGVCIACCGSGRRRWDGCDVRVRYRYKASERAAFSEATVRDLFVGALRLKVEGVAVADRNLRAPEVAAAKTLPEKLAAYFKTDSLSPSLAAKLALLERHDADQVFGEVAQALAAIERPQETTVAA
jgi:DNA repair exonuclease SbcCD nuclease subunit